MTIDEYSIDVHGLEDNSGPSRDPQEQAMVDHLVEFETEMYRLECQHRFSRMRYTELKRLMIDLHGEDWEIAL